MKVLIVEDDILIRIFVRKTLFNNGCEEVFETPEGGEALDIVEQNLPEVVLIDIKLKGSLDGIEIAKRIKSDADKDVTLVYMSAYDQAVFDQEEIDSLFDYYLSKPIDPDEVKELCEKLSSQEGRHDK